MSLKSIDYLKDSLDALSQKIYGKPFGNLGKKEQSDSLSRLFVTSALEYLGGHGDTADRFEDGYTDGSGDLEIDLLIKVGKEVHNNPNKIQRL